MDIEDIQFHHSRGSDTEDTVGTVGTADTAGIEDTEGFADSDIDN